MTTTITNAGKHLTVLTGKEAANIMRLAEDAYLPSHYENIITQIEMQLGKALKWKPLGGEGRVAHSALGSSGEATHLLTEPVINFNDAALDMKHQLALKAGDTSVPKSMAEAANRWFGVPLGGLPVWDTAPGGTDRQAFMELAAKSRFIIRQGSTDKTPTIVFSDDWLGQHPADHEETILSLQKGLKADIPFLAGQFGHGAAFTFAFSNSGQILVSRRHPDLLAPGYEDLVGLSLVRRRMPSETGLANPGYFYAVCPDTDAPVAFYPDSLSDPRWHGLHRVCLDYEMQKTTRRAIYYALEYNICNPALPYAFWDERPNGTHQKLFLGGITSRLQRAYDGRKSAAGKDPVLVPYRRTAVVDLDAFIGDGGNYGDISITMNFVTQDNNVHPGEQFVPAKEAELWTMNGQRHHARSRIHFGQSPIKLEAIRDNLVVEVKLDGLSPDAKAMLLTTDRQGAAERSVRFKVEEAIDEQLSIDTDLRALNEAALAEALAKAAGSNFAELDKELAQFENMIRTETKTVTVKKQVQKPSTKTPPPTPPVLAPISPLQTHPTFLRFRKVFRETIRIAPGKTASVLVEADAIDGYFGPTRQPSYQFTPATGSALTVYSQTDLVDGRMRVRIKAADNAALGQTQLTASYLPPNAPAPLSTMIDVEIAVPAPKNKGKGPTKPVFEDVEEEQRIQTPPQHSVVYETISPTWADAKLNDWTIDTVAEFKNGMVYINGDYRHLGKLLKDGATAQTAEYLKLYIAPIVMSVVGITNEETNPPKDEDGVVLSLPTVFRDAAFQAAALGAIFTIRKLKKLGLGGMVVELDGD